MRRGTILIVLGILGFLSGIVLIRVSIFLTEAPVQYKETVVEYKESIPSTIAILLSPPTRFGINITGPFQSSTEGQPVVEIRDPEGSLIYSNSSFPPPSIIELDSTTVGLYSIDFNIVFGNGSSVEVYYYSSRIEVIQPYRDLYYPGVFLAVLGIAVSAAGMFLPSKRSEES